MGRLRPAMIVADAASVRETDTRVLSARGAVRVGQRN
jgi:hypothetical protein